MNTYERKFRVKCPNDDDSIEYTLVIETTKMIMVEDIIDKTMIVVPAFHEAIADQLLLEIGGKQTITAVHQCVKITTVRQ